MIVPGDQPDLDLNISAAERETGLSKDVLRMWERRYGFPHPTRDDNAERRYPADQVAKLRAIKRLMETGMRPGKLIEQSLEELNLPGTDALTYRPAPRLNLDEKLILLHDAAPVHKVVEFPVLRDGRGVIFCSGRMHIVSEEVFEKLLAADDALRERLELDEGARRE